MAISDRKGRFSCIINNLLFILTLAGVVAGMAIGILVRRTDPTQDMVIWIGLPGDVYMRSLKMMILPLIVTSVITGTASLDPNCNGKISMVSLVYIVVTNSLACLVPIMITLAAEPGKRTTMKGDIANKDSGVTTIETIDVFADLLRNLFPANIIAACFQQQQTKYENITDTSSSSDLNTTLVKNQTEMVTQNKVLGTVSSTNVLGLVIFSFIIGLATSSIGSAGRPFFVFFRSANDVIIKVLNWLIWITPLGVASLIADAFLKVKSLDIIITSLGYFCLIVIGCLALHVACLAVIVNLIALRENPFPFLAAMSRAYTVSFATASASIAIPDVIYALESKVGLDKRVARFTVPLATAINRDGSSIFIGISCVFLAQLSGHSVNAGQIIILWALLSFISMATPSIPSSSIVVIYIILSSLGFPTDLVGLLFATEWLLDRARTCVNVISHCYCTLIVHKLCREDLAASAKENDDAQQEENGLIAVEEEIVTVPMQNKPS